MRARIVGMAAGLVLGGCGTSDDVKRTGVVWQGTVAARYDQLAICLSRQTTLYYKATLALDRREQRATVTFSIPVTGIPVEVYDLRQASDDATQISWSTRLERGRHPTGKPFYLLDLCGASALPGTAPPPSGIAPPAVPPVAPPATPPAGSTAPGAPEWAPDNTTDTPSEP